MKVRLSSILAVGLVMMVLASCGGTPAAAPTAAPAQPAPSGGEAVTINFLTLDDADMNIALNAVTNARVFNVAVGESVG